MTKIILGFAIGFLVGAGCRWLDIPAPSPPSIIGALLVVAMTFGYVAADRWLTARSHPPATTAHLCGGPSGDLIAQSRPKG